MTLTLENAKAGNVEKALENVYFTSEGITSNYKEMLTDALSRTFDYESYKINAIEEINKNIYLGKIVLPQKRANSRSYLIEAGRNRKTLTSNSHKPI